MEHVQKLEKLIKEKTQQLDELQKKPLSKIYLEDLENFEKELERMEKKEDEIIAKNDKKLKKPPTVIKRKKKRRKKNDKTMDEYANKKDQKSNNKKPKKTKVKKVIKKIKKPEKNFSEILETNVYRGLTDDLRKNITHTTFAALEQGEKNYELSIHEKLLLKELRSKRKNGD